MSGKTKKALLLTIGACLLLFVINLAYTSIRDRFRALVLETSDLNEQETAYIDDFLKNDLSGTERKLVLQLSESSDEGKRKEADLHIAPWLPELAPDLLYPLPDSADALLPSTIRSIGRESGDSRLALPIALDHVELSFRRDLFSRQGLRIEERIIALSDMEQVLYRLSGPDFIPLMTAGGDDIVLLDFISVLLLSLEGHEAYRILIDTITNEQAKEEPDWETVCTGTALASTLDLARSWRQDGILHNDWTAFSRQEVMRMAEQGLCAAVVMRLSEHRSWSMDALKNMQASPFPFRDPTQAGSALMAPVYTVYVNAESRLAEETAKLAPLFAQEAFQEKVLSQWGLGPVHATVEVRDRESGDLRYWAAASRRLLSPLSYYLTDTELNKLAETLRVLLRK